MDLEEQYNREHWMTETQWECAKFLASLFGGFHHMFGIIRETRNGVYINCTSAKNHFSTYDYDFLTRAVVKAHDQCIRFGIEPSGPGMLHLSAVKRKSRDGYVFDKRPTLEQAIEKIRGEQ